MALHEQQAVYGAQEALSDFGQRFWDLGAAEIYLHALMTEDWFLDKWGSVPVRLFEWSSTRWSACADRDGGVIYLTPSGLNEKTLLHELAHVLCDEDGHGQCFVDTFLFLIRKRSLFAWANFRSALRETGVFQV